MTDTGQVHVREHRPARAPDGGRADRSPASTSTRSTGACTRTCRRASSSCWRAACRSVQRFDDGLLTVTQLTRDDFAADGRRGELLRGRRRPPALGRGHRGRRRSCASCPPTATAAAAPQGLAARDRRPRRRLAHRPRRRRRRPPPGGRLLDASSAIAELVEFLRVRACAGSSEPRHSAATASSSSTSRPASRRTTSSRPCGGGSGAGRARSGHAGTLDPFATGLLLVLVGRATRVQRFLMALPKRYETVGPARLRPRRRATPRARSPRPARMPAEPLVAADRARSASARRPTRRSRSAASAPTSWRAAARRSSWPSAR